MRETAGGVIFAVRVQPRASRTAVLGWYGEGDDAALKVALAAPPVDGKANESLVRFLSELLAVPRSSVAIVSGESSRNKVVRISGVRVELARERLGSN